MENKTPKSLDEIKQLRKPIPNVNILYRQKLTRLERLALWITNHVGSMGFFIIIFSWTILWLSWNALATKVFQTDAFDPYPAFVLWLFISNMIQIFLMPLIMIGQNLQSRHAEALAETDFEVDRKAEFEIETILMHLENQNKLILQILEHLQKKSDAPDSSLL